ncbi:MAG: hypothetical protein QXR53_05005 [Candidatus Norongarragalinales archaeon]
MNSTRLNSKITHQEQTELALRTLHAIIRKQKRTISDVASIRRRSCENDAGVNEVNRWERAQIYLLEEHFDPSTFRDENPYLCSEEQERALRAFAQSTDLEAWLWSHRNKHMSAAKVAVYASRIRLLIAMTLGQTEAWLLSYTPALDCIALECAAVARINHGAEEVTARMHSALNTLIHGLQGSSLTPSHANGNAFGSIALTEVICEGKRVALYEACTSKFVWANSLAINTPEACVLQWLELRLGNNASRAEVRELLKQTFTPLSEEERTIINTAFLKFVNAYAS